MVGSVYNLTLNNHASKVVEEMPSTSKLNNNVAMVPQKVKHLQPSGVGAIKFGELGVDTGERHAQSHQKLAGRFPSLLEEAKEKEAPKIGVDVNQDETNTFDEFQRGILSERKSRLNTVAQLEHPGSPANVSRQIVDVLGPGNKTDDIN